MTRCALLATTFSLAAAGLASAQAVSNRKYGQEDKFRQLDEVLSTPTDVRTASGAPGARYWQQRADYEIDVELNDDDQSIHGSERVVYTNNSPDPLSYVWLQVDNNLLTPGSDAHLSATAPELDRAEVQMMRSILEAQSFDGGAKIHEVADERGAPLPFSVVKTMMRIDLPEPLAPGGRFSFRVRWSCAINDAKVLRARTGYEHFPEDGNYIYEIAHWFPRLAAYTDVNGWQHKQFLGQGEFTLEFGDYLVRITVPDDHIVGATGVLQNPEEALSPEQMERLSQARTADRPVFIVPPDEAKARQTGKPGGKKTWVYKAENVRDFAFASSRKFIWDAKLHKVGDNDVMCMSLYPNEAEPLWSRYSTHAVMHTLDVYSKYTFDYPYPTAISVNGPVGGMEYPMICFNGPRPEKDGTYSKGTKYGLISVIIHEVGHNYFPMIVNSDERQWTWMDEGLNTFLQYLAEQEWEEGYPSQRGEPKDVAAYMRSARQVPVMTNSESVLQFGNNAYAKPAAALNILRETVLGRDLFDFAFRTYARRWMFKRPTPADFFRTMEDASGVDLDWFWRGWFYTTDHVDVAIDGLRYYEISTGDPDVDKGRAKEKRAAEPTTVSAARNKEMPKRADRFPELKDFYNTFDELDVVEEEREQFQKFLERLDDREKETLKTAKRFYVVDLTNVGGLVTPVVLKISYADGESEEARMPAEIWRFDHKRVSKLLVVDREIVSVEFDPHLETADADRDNNVFPRRPKPAAMKIFKEELPKNPMQKQQERKSKSDGDSPAPEAPPAKDDSE